MADDGKVEKLETKIDVLDTKVATLDSRITVVEAQVARLTSHVESEVGLARSDLARIEERLVGKEDTRYSGRLGEINKDLDSFKLKFAYGAGFVGALLFALEMYRVFK